MIFPEETAAVNPKKRIVLTLKSALNYIARQQEVLSKPEVTTREVLPTLMLMLASIFLFDWIEEKLFGRTTGIGIAVGWIVGLSICYGASQFRNSKLDSLNGGRREAGEE
ncbi:hypothetical protein I6F16_17170 [Bradyrhizobium sp. IC4060]|nr:hypothetical protein [Bradyrhizobium sp. IC4060]MCA1485486.1 hypothetical protein [Bradyrhizobium sp. IC4061]